MYSLNSEFPINSQRQLTRSQCHSSTVFISELPFLLTISLTTLKGLQVHSGPGGSTSIFWKSVQLLWNEAQWPFFIYTTSVSYMLGIFWLIFSSSRSWSVDTFIVPDFTIQHAKSQSPLSLNGPHIESPLSTWMLHSNLNVVASFHMCCPTGEQIGRANNVCLMEWHLCQCCLEWHWHCLKLCQCLDAVHQEALYALLRWKAQEIVVVLWNTQCKYTPLCMPVCSNADHFSLSQSLAAKLWWFLMLPATLHCNSWPVQDGSIVPALKGKHVYNTFIRTS